MYEAGMPAMEAPTNVGATTERRQVAALAGTQTPTALAPNAAATPYRDDAVSNKMPDGGSMTSMPSMSSLSSTLHFGVGDALWVQPLTPETDQGYFGAIFLLVSMTLVLRSLSIARGRFERRWAAGAPSSCKGIEANNAPKARLEDNGGQTDAVHAWDPKRQLVRGVFTMTTTVMGYLL